MTEREHERIKQTYRETVEADISEDLDEELYRIAERRVRLAIVLTKIGYEQNVRIPSREVERLLETYSEQDPEHGAQILDYYIENPTAIAELQSSVFEDRVVDQILARADIVNRDVTAAELLSM